MDSAKSRAEAMIGEASDDAAGAAAGVVSELLTRETDRKNSLEQRGITVITTSSTLATLVFAIATLVTKSTSHESLVGSEKAFVLLGLTLFVIAGVLGILVNAPRAGHDITADEAATYLSVNSQAEIVRKAAAKRIETLRSRRTANVKKGILLTVAFASEVGAVFAVGIAVFIIVLRLP